MGMDRETDGRGGFEMSRRAVLAGIGGAVVAAAGLEGSIMAQETSKAGAATPAEPFIYCLNTSTLRGQQLPLAKTVDLAAAAGYQAIEPWISEIEAHQKQGGSLADMKKRIADLGMTVESAIGFAEWIPEGEQRRKLGLERMKQDMDLVAQIGGKRVAAPPVGAQHKDAGPVDLFKAAERYRAILELGKQTGVVPQVELWGFSRNLSRLGEVAFVAIESGHPDACILADVYHIYKGGSDASGLRLLSGDSMHVLHMNDYPANPPRADINDDARIFPGDGVAPLTKILRTLRDIGYRGALSLELFNATYWKQDAAAVAKAGLEKMRAAVRTALG